MAGQPRSDSILNPGKMTMTRSDVNGLGASGGTFIERTR